MTIHRDLIVLIFLFCFFVNAPAQYLVPCQSRAKIVRDPNNPFPNELEDLKFIGKGNLSAFTFLVTTRKDVRSIFGTPLEVKNNTEIYDYDSDWLITFSYFDAKYSKIGTDGTENGVWVSKDFVPKPEYIGKMFYIRLSPKKNIPFNRMSYLDKSIKETRISGNFYTILRDAYGLTYSIVDRDVGALGNGLRKDLEIKQGDILEIEYTYSCSIDKNIYV